MSKQKAQGTAHESWTVKALAAIGIQARRIAEGGSADEGDVEAHLPDGRWVLEGKATQTLNVQKILAKARRKAGGNTPVAVIWKRLVPVPGKQVRQPVDGERIVVIMSWDDFIRLVQNNGSHGSTVIDNQPEGPTNVDA
jgi:hypothetical protein